MHRTEEEVFKGPGREEVKIMFTEESDQLYPRSGRG